jgi:hypothetical protein
MLRRWLTSMLVLAGLTLPALGEDAVRLKWNFQKNKRFYQEVTTETKQTMKVMGMEVVQTQMQTLIISWTPKKRDKDKNWIVTQKIEAVKMNIESGGNTINYDSTNEDSSPANTRVDSFKALVGLEFKLTISPELKIIKIEGRDEFLNKLVKSNPSEERFLKQILSDEALKQMPYLDFDSVPARAVNKGETWEKKSTINMGPIGGFDTTYTYKYEGLENKLEKISVKTALKYKPPEANAGGALPFKIKYATLESKDVSGSVLFDNAKHRPDSSTMNLKLEGKLTIDVVGTGTDVDLTLDQKTTVKTTDTNPAAAATAFRRQPSLPVPLPRQPCPASNARSQARLICRRPLCVCQRGPAGQFRSHSRCFPCLEVHCRIENKILGY